MHGVYVIFGNLVLNVTEHLYFYTRQMKIEV